MKLPPARVLLARTILLVTVATVISVVSDLFHQPWGRSFSVNERSVLAIPLVFIGLAAVSAAIVLSIEFSLRTLAQRGKSDI